MTEPQAQPHDASHEEHHLAHIMPLKVLVAVFVALVLLTFLTVGVSELRLGNIALYVALAVAGIKGTLVALYFMHLRYDKPFNLILFLATFAFVVIFISGVLTDTTHYQSSVIPGQAPAMKDVHTPFGTPK